MKKKILVLCFNNLKIDARVMRQSDFIKDEYQVSVLCYDGPEDTPYELIRVRQTNLTFLKKVVLSFVLLFRLHPIAYRLLYPYHLFAKELRRQNFDLILANDVETLPLAFQISNQHKPVFLDAHEYAPRHFEDRLYWRIFFQPFNAYICRKYLPKLQGMSTVNETLAQEYEKNFQVRPIVVTNATDYFDLEPVMRGNYPIRLVHHGIFNRSRQPENLLSLIRSLDGRFTLDLIFLMPPQASPQTHAYFEQYVKQAEELGRIKILPAVKHSDLPRFLNDRYDVGIISIPPINFNYASTLPNKLFEGIQARIALAVSPTPEISRVVNKYDIGVVAEDFSPEALATSLSTISLDRLNEMKRNVHRIAFDMSSVKNKQLLLTALKETLNRSLHPASR